MTDASRTKAPVKAPESRKPGPSDIGHRTSAIGHQPKPTSYDEKKKADAEARRVKKESEARNRRIQDLEARIERAEAEIRDLELKMAAGGFYENHETAKPIIDRHQALMWEVGDLMQKWEMLQAETEV